MSKDFLKQLQLLQSENSRLQLENDHLKSLLTKEQLKDFKGLMKKYQVNNTGEVNKFSSSKEKIALFMSLFKGRNDICAKKWKNKSGYSPYCFNDFRPGVCFKPKIKCKDCFQADFAPLDEIRIEKHLKGDYVLGLYPMTEKDTCFLLVMDFDESTWQEDVKVVNEVCRLADIPVYTERSRSGNGAHLWYFFAEEISAALARRFGTAILNKAMETGKNIKFNSYDRLFPSQDFLPKDGFGNLVALPLQKEARENGNSVFLDEDLHPIFDQWNFLSKVEKITESFVKEFCKSLEKTEEDINERKTGSKISEITKDDFPEKLLLHRCNGIKIEASGISARGMFALRKLASYHNPEFYAKQSMRQSTYGIPRITEVYEETKEYIRLPRGVEKELVELLNRKEIKFEIEDSRYSGAKINAVFQGDLYANQELAFQELTKFENGILSATTGFGKTVIGAKLIAEKGLSTLILVHTKELANQWQERLESFLKIDSAPLKRKNSPVIGRLGGGKKTLNGIVDIAIMQSMFEKDKSVKDLIDNYGLVIVDECHHVSATNFSRILSEVKAKFVYGLTATPIRQDGHTPILFMHCGEIRYKVDAKKEALNRSFKQYLIPRFTATRIPYSMKKDNWHITEIYQYICENEKRTNLIVTDVVQSIMTGQRPLVLTERTEHVKILAEKLRQQKVEVIELLGSMKTKERKAAVHKIKSCQDIPIVLISTGKLIGEGFDEASLDALFLAMPIAWKGKVAQYTGRLHREYKGKSEVLVYDYVDFHIPVLERMYQKRLKAYHAVGYSIKNMQAKNTIGNGIYTEDNYSETLLNDIYQAKQSIVISSLFLQKKKVDSLKKVLLGKYKSGVRVSICLKGIADYPSKYRKFITEFTREMENEGITICEISGNYLKFAVVDQCIAWYGDIDILGGEIKDTSMIRIENSEIASELLESIIE